MSSQAIKDVWLERERQITEEGWSAAHDDEHLPGHLARAGACYALYEASEAKAFSEWLLSVIRSIWPFEWSWWKPKDRRRNLVRAAALIIAEIERLDRAEKAGAK